MASGPFRKDCMKLSNDSKDHLMMSQPNLPGKFSAGEALGSAAQVIPTDLPENWTFDT